MYNMLTIKGHSQSNFKPLKDSETWCAATFWAGNEQPPPAITTSVEGFIIKTQTGKLLQLCYWWWKGKKMLSGSQVWICMAAHKTFVFRLVNNIRSHISLMKSIEMATTLRFSPRRKSLKRHFFQHKRILWRRHEKGNLNSAVWEDLPSNRSGQNEFSLSIFHSITRPHYLTFSYLLIKPQHPSLFKLVVRVQHGDLCCSLSHNLIVESSRISTSLVSTTQTLLYGASCDDVTLSWMSAWMHRTPLKKSRPTSWHAWNEMFKWKTSPVVKGRWCMWPVSLWPQPVAAVCPRETLCIYPISSWRRGGMRGLCDTSTLPL